MDEQITYKERMKERNKILTELNILKVKVEEIKNKIKSEKNELENFYIEKSELENKIKDLEEKFIKVGIPVPEDEEYEIVNGLFGMKRDINLKLIKYLEEENVKQV
jgi:hypothetical protein